MVFNSQQLSEDEENGNYDVQKCHATAFGYFVFVEKKKFCRERFLPTEILLHLLLHSSLPCFTVFNSLLSLTIVLEIQNETSGEHSLLRNTKLKYSHSFILEIQNKNLREPLCLQGR